MAETLADKFQLAYNRLLTTDGTIDADDDRAVMKYHQNEVLKCLIDVAVDHQKEIFEGWGSERDLAMRQAAGTVFETCDEIEQTLNPIEYRLAKTIERGTQQIRDIVIGEFLISEIIGYCEGCGCMILHGDDVMHADDGCNLCAECQPSPEELAQIVKDQAAPPIGIPEPRQRADGTYFGEGAEAWNWWRETQKQKEQTDNGGEI